MKKRMIMIVAITVFSLAGCQGNAQEMTNVPTLKPTEAPTAAATSIPETTPTATPEVTEAPTAAATPAPTATPEATEAPTATATPAPTATPEATEAPTAVATSIPETTPTATPEATEAPTSTATPAPTATPVPTATADSKENPVPGKTALSYQVFSDFSDSSNSGMFEVHACTSELLTEGNVEFVIAYTAPKEMQICVFNPPDGEVYKKLDFPKTTGIRETLTFTLSKQELEAAGYPTISFYMDDNNRVFLSLTKDSEYAGQGGSVNDGSGQQGTDTWEAIKVTDGVPTGKTVCAYVNTSGLPRPQTYQIHGCTVQELNNNYFRFTLEYTAPADTEICITTKGKPSLFAMTGVMEAGKHQKLVFDVSKTDIEKESYFLISFPYENSLYYAYVVTSFFEPSGNIPKDAELLSFYEYDLAQIGNYSIHHIYAQELGNGRCKFYIDCTMPKDRYVQVQDTYNCSIFVERLDARTTGTRQTISFELEMSKLQADEFIVFFYHETEDRIGLVISTKGLNE